MASEAIDQANAAFWDELCGTELARQIGVTDRSLESLRRFDRAYMELYPYLPDRVPVSTMRGKRVLEVGLGYGTVGQKIAEAGADYIGLDIAQGPVDMMNQRLATNRLPGKAIRGSMLDCPLPDASVDCVVSIGCFHHTGDVARCIEQTWRVLKPGGTAYLMVYNRFSYWQWIRWPLRTLRGGMGGNEAQRKAYDWDSSGVAAPETVFLSRDELKGLLARFSKVQMALENCHRFRVFGRVVVPRRLLLATLGRVAGLDVYISAAK